MNNRAMGGARATGERERDNWRTPKWLMDVLHAEFPMLWDATGRGPDEWAHGCVFGNRETDALSSTWAVDVPVFCNPPFSQMIEWAARIVAHPGQTVTVCKLAPSTAWFKELTRGDIDQYVTRQPLNLGSREGFINILPMREDVDIWLLPCRVAYEPPPGIKASSPRFDSCVIVRR